VGAVGWSNHVSQAGVKQTRAALLRVKKELSEAAWVQVDLELLIIFAGWAWLLLHIQTSHGVVVFHGALVTPLTELLGRTDYASEQCNDWLRRLLCLVQWKKGGMLALRGPCRVGFAPIPQSLPVPGLLALKRAEVVARLAEERLPTKGSLSFLRGELAAADAMRSEPSTDDSKEKISQAEQPAQLAEIASKKRAKASRPLLAKKAKREPTKLEGLFHRKIQKPIRYLSDSE